MSAARSRRAARRRSVPACGVRRRGRFGGGARRWRGSASSRRRWRCAAASRPPPTSRRTWTRIIRSSRRDGVSLAQASVAIVSVEGAPDAISASFSQALEREARARDIVVVDRRQGALSRARLSFGRSDRRRRFDRIRLGRLHRRQAARAKAQRRDRGQGIGRRPLGAGRRGGARSVAARSADDLAAYLSNTPEAVARRPAPAAGAPASYAAQ